MALPATDYHFNRETNMKAHLNRKELLAALDVAVAVAPKHSPKPILECVRIEAADGVVTLTATDLERGVTITLNKVDVTEPGVVAVHPNLLREFAKSSVDDVLLLSGVDTITTEKVEDGPPGEKYLKSMKAGDKLHWVGNADDPNPLDIIVETVQVHSDEVAVTVSGINGVDLGCPISELRVVTITKRDVVTITERVGRCELAFEDAKDFPTVRFANGPYIWLHGDKLCSMLAQVEKAQDLESSRYALGGVKFEYAKGELTLISTDGRRLHKTCSTADCVDWFDLVPAGELKMPDPCIIPASTVKVLKKISKVKVVAMVPVAGSESVVEGAKVVTPSVRPGMTFYAGDVVLTTMLCEGRFPRWRDVFPSETDRVLITVEAGKWRDALKRVLPATGVEYRGVEFDFAGDKLTMKAGSGRAETEVDVAFGGTPCGITLDPRFVLDILAPCDKRDVLELSLSGTDTADRASLWKHNGYSAVVMPLARNK
jgi:DNA polymerase-3 subunit beta